MVPAASGQLLEPPTASRRLRGEKHPDRRKRTMRGVLLWLIGIPIPIIILLYLFDVI
jgi:hypothetical protein